jgi:Skp family chaperone for outer membrane proteins
MSKRSLLLLLVFWNVLLSGAIIWSLSRSRVPDKILKEKLSGLEGTDSLRAPMAADTTGRADARIAFFFMDSVQGKYLLVKESTERVRNEGQRMEGALQREMQKAQGRYQELMAKDHTYSTQAELAKDQAELEQLGQKIQEMRTNSQDQLDRMQMEMLKDITAQIQGFLEEYNRSAGYDYIFSIQDAGQIWVGNKGLDITDAVVDGLNARHSAKTAPVGK